MGTDVTINFEKNFLGALTGGFINGDFNADVRGGRRSGVRIDSIDWSRLGGNGQRDRGYRVTGTEQAAVSTAGASAEEFALPLGFSEMSFEKQAEALIDLQRKALDSGNKDTFDSVNQQVATFITADGNERLRDAYREERNASGFDDTLIARRQELQNMQTNKGGSYQAMVASLDIPDEVRASIIPAFDQLANARGRQNRTEAVRDIQGVMAASPQSFAGSYGQMERAMEEATGKDFTFLSRDAARERLEAGGNGWNRRQMKSVAEQLGIENFNIGSFSGNASEAETGAIRQQTVNPDAAARLAARNARSDER